MCRLSEAHLSRLVNKEWRLVFEINDIFVNFRERTTVPRNSKLEFSALLFVPRLCGHNFFLYANVSRRSVRNSSYILPGCSSTMTLHRKIRTEQMNVFVVADKTVSQLRTHQKRNKYSLTSIASLNEINRLNLLTVDAVYFRLI